MHYRGAIYAASLAMLISGLAVLPAAAEPARPSKPTEPPRTVTLITGDKVTVAKTGDTWDVKIQPAKRLGVPAGFMKSMTRDGVTVIPSDAAPLVRSGKLDRALFDVTGLIKLEYDDAHTADIPLLVESGPAATALGKVTRQLPAANITAVTTPKQRAADVFGNAATTKVWLNGKAFPSLDQSVPQVHAPEAWQAGHTGAGATVAVLDTGYDQNHPDLAGIVKGSKDFTGEGVQDTVGHGTHVASTIAGRGTASGGKYKGVAKGANLLVGKVCTLRGCTFDAILAGMQWAGDSGVKVVNMSLGSAPGDGTGPLDEAVNRISAATGTLFVIAAGNDGSRAKVSSPAAADAAMAVGSVSKQDQISRFSQPGPRLKDFAVKPDIAAPGEQIVAARAKGTMDQWAVDEFHAKLDGTSMATPHVAGAAAIVAAQHPDWTGAQIKTTLMGTADPVAGTIYQQGAGRLNVGRAVGQTVTASVGSLSMGYIKWPYDLKPITKPVTYRNSGPAPVTLRLTVDAPFRTDVNQVTVPAQGEATVNVTFEPANVGPAEFAARLVANGDNVIVRTPVGAYKEVESYDLKVRLIDRNGQESAPGFQSDWIWRRTDGTDNPSGFQLNGDVAHLPAGKYGVLAVVTNAVPGKATLAMTSMAEPEIDLRKNTEIVLDARKAKPVTVRTDEPDAQLVAGVTGMELTGNGRPTGYTLGMTDDVYALPTTGTSTSFAYFNRYQLERPAVTLNVTKPESFQVPVEWLPDAPTLTGSNPLTAVHVGHAKPDEIAGRDLKGKLAVFTLGAGEQREFDGRVEALKAAGAKAVLYYLSEPIQMSVRQVPTIPTLLTRNPAGSRLAQLGTADATVAALPPSPYRYELAFPHKGSIPANAEYRPRNNDLATVKARYHAPSEGGTAILGYSTRAGDLRLDENLWTPEIPLPLERTEYYSPDPVTWQTRVYGLSHAYLSAERNYRPGEKLSLEWGKAVIGPTVAGPDLVFRDGDTITATLPLFSDSQGHIGFADPDGFKDTGDTVLYANGSEVGRSGVPGSGTFQVGQAPADYRLVASANRDHPSWPLSTKVSAEWTFKSGRTSSATPLPLLSVSFDPKLDLANYARGNTLFAIPVRVDRLPGTTGGPATPRNVEMSTNDGSTWRPVPMIKIDGQWWAGVPNPASGFVSLRASASDTTGNAVTETIIRAYRVR